MGVKFLPGRFGHWGPLTLLGLPWLVTVGVPKAGWLNCGVAGTFGISREARIGMIGSVDPIGEFFCGRLS